MLGSGASGRRGAVEEAKVGEGLGEMRMQFRERLEDDDSDDEDHRSQNPEAEQPPEGRGQQQVWALESAGDARKQMNTEIYNVYYSLFYRYNTSMAFLDYIHSSANYTILFLHCVLLSNLI